MFVKYEFVFKSIIVFGLCCSNTPCNFAESIGSVGGTCHNKVPITIRKIPELSVPTYF